MTDKEIIQALRVCSRRTDAQTCAECPLFDSEDCMGDMMVGAADLIERLTAENTALREGASLGKAKRPQKKAYEKSIEFLRALTDGQSDEIKSLRRELEGKDMVIILAQRKQTEAEAERDALQEKQRWIPVTERMPNTIPCNAGTEYSEAVIVWTTGNKAMIAVWDGIDFICPTDFWEAWGEEITHWMPLPGAPEVNDGKENS
mgnify:CR=1 FL=1